MIVTRGSLGSATIGGNWDLTVAACAEDRKDADGSTSEPHGPLRNPRHKKRVTATRLPDGCGGFTIRFVQMAKRLSGLRKRTYTIRCRGITQGEYFELLSAFRVTFSDQRRMVLRNPLPAFDAAAVSFLTLLLPAGVYAGKKVVDILAEIVKAKIARGDHGKTIIIYGPDGKPRRRIRK